MSHTKTPYKASKTNWRGEPVEHDVIVLGNATSGTIADETAAFIVRACNSHDDLLAALHRIANLQSESDGEMFEEMFFAAEQIARYAIAKTKEN